MKEIFRLALRNLREHKSKTLIIALFILFGTAIVILGNSFLESVNRGLEKDFRANYTGDVVISHSPSRGQIIDIFGVTSKSFSGQIPQLPALDNVDASLQFLENSKGIKSYTKFISAKVLIVKNSDELDLSEIMDDDSLTLTDLPVSELFAGEEFTYFTVFDSINIIEGNLPEAGSNQILVEDRLRNGYHKTYKTPLNIGDSVLVAGANTNGVIREATVCGFFKPKNENSAMFQCIYTSPDFARAFADLTYASTFTQELPSSVDMALSSVEEDDLFGDEDLFSISDGEDFLSSSSIDYDSILGDVSLRDELNKVDTGAWNFILIKTDSQSSADNLISFLNQSFSNSGINNQAVNWKSGAYSYTQTVAGINIIFNILIIILAVVVFIIIMNTMTVSVIERTGEIGTMRAIGAEKKFVNRLFFTESFMITGVSAIAGTVLAVIIALIFNSLNISITNSIAKMILGGGLLHFSLTPRIIISTIIIAIIGSLISNIYPVSSALKITPLKALSKGSE